MFGLIHIHVIRSYFLLLVFCFFLKTVTILTKLTICNKTIFLRIESEISELLFELILIP